MKFPALRHPRSKEEFSTRGIIILTITGLAPVAALFLVVLAVALGVGLGIGLSKRGSSDDNSSQVMTTNITAQPTSTTTTNTITTTTNTSTTTTNTSTTTTYTSTIAASTSTPLTNYNNRNSIRSTASTTTTAAVTTTIPVPNSDSCILDSSYTCSSLCRDTDNSYIVTIDTSCKDGTDINKCQSPYSTYGCCCVSSDR
jgi:hypothetical protein